MEIGISTGLFYEKDLLESLPLIQESGFKVVELWAGASKWGQFTHYNWHEKSYTAQLKKKLNELGLKVSAMHAPFSETSDISNADEDQRKFAVDECCKVIDILSDLRGTFLILHPAVKIFDLNDHEEKERRLNQTRKSIGKIAEHAKLKGRRVALENLLPHILGGEVNILIDLVRSFNRYSLGICFDSSHANLWKNPTVDEYLKLVSPYLLTTHFSDNYGQFDDHHPPGDGEMNWPALVNILKESGYQGVFMLEVLGESKGKDPREVLTKAYNRSYELLSSAKLI